MKLPRIFKLNPITHKRLRRFRQRKRAYWSFWLILVIYGLSLVAELWVNSVPLYVRYEGVSYFPALKSLFGGVYSEDIFTGSGLASRTDYKMLEQMPRFGSTPGNFMIWPVVRSGPHEIFTDEKLRLPEEVTVMLTPATQVGRVNIDQVDKVVRALNAEWFFRADTAAEVIGETFTEHWPLPGAIRQGLQKRFSNQPAEAVSHVVANDAGQEIELQLSPYAPRMEPPESVRITLREVADSQLTERLVFDGDGEIIEGESGTRWQAASDDQRKTIREAVAKRADGMLIGDMSIFINGVNLRVDFQKEDFRVPFRPVRGHWLGIDHSGRDVFARLVYGLRIAMSFGLLLVILTMIIGVAIGAVQGYYGGLLDISAQRLIEIWSAIPFLYVMILLGSIYGQSFMLLLGVYGVFHWIGISYYMRAEFLKLRKEPFVEAARCMGIPTWKILFKHILPNGLVPIITFFPFSLVGAIGVLTALDYLGFGLPPGTPSWGELLAQAQDYSYAWWLVLYPFLILFITILLCVFVGEGVRAAFDPRRYSRMQ